MESSGMIATESGGLFLRQQANRRRQEAEKGKIAGGGRRRDERARGVVERVQKQGRRWSLTPPSSLKAGIA
eukprot:6213847-Pleurochrysis_carterae.AAC.3